MKRDNVRHVRDTTPYGILTIFTGERPTTFCCATRTETKKILTVIFTCSCIALVEIKENKIKENNVG